MSQLPFADIYCRSATEEWGTQAKFERQETACRAYCEEHGLTVGLVHREVAGGMTYRDRTQFSLLRARYYRGEIQGVVVSHLDRISRSQVHLFILMEEMSAYGITLHSVKEQIDEGATGRFIRVILNFIAEVDHEKKLDTLRTDIER